MSSSLHRLRIVITRDIQTGAECRGTGWRRDVPLKARPPSAWWAGRSAATAWSRRLRRPPSLSPAVRSARGPEEIAHRPSGSFDCRLAKGRLPEAAGVQPGAVRAGEFAIEIGDGSDDCRPNLGRRVFVGAIVTAGMEAQRSGFVQRRNAASAQICFGERAPDRQRRSRRDASRPQAIPLAPRTSCLVAALVLGLDAGGSKSAGLPRQSA